MTTSTKAERSCLDLAGLNSGATRDASRAHEKARREEAYTGRMATRTGSQMLWPTRSNHSTDGHSLRLNHDRAGAVSAESPATHTMEIDQ